MVAAMGNRGGEDPPAMEAEEAMEAARTVDAMKVVEVVVVAMAAEAAATMMRKESLTCMRCMLVARAVAAFCMPTT